MTYKTAMSRAELELAVRAEMVDLAPTTWHARLAADYILRVLDEYVQAERERQQRRQREVVEFFLAGEAGAGRPADSQIATWVAAEWHRAICDDKDHLHEDTPWSAALTS